MPTFSVQEKFPFLTVQDRRRLKTLVEEHHLLVAHPRTGKTVWKGMGHVKKIDPALFARMRKSYTDVSITQLGTLAEEPLRTRAATLGIDPFQDRDMLVSKCTAKLLADWLMDERKYPYQNIDSTLAELEESSYHDLQRLAVSLKLRANTKRPELLQTIRDELLAQYLDKVQEAQSRVRYDPTIPWEYPKHAAGVSTVPVYSGLQFWIRGVELYRVGPHSVKLVLKLSDHAGGHPCHRVYLVRHSDLGTEAVRVRDRRIRKKFDNMTGYPLTLMMEGAYTYASQGHIVLE